MIKLSYCNLRKLCIYSAYLDKFVISSGNEAVSIAGDIQSINRSSLRSLKLSDERSIKVLPVTDLSVGTTGDDLALVRVVGDGLEESVSKHDLVSHKSPSKKTKKFSLWMIFQTRT